MHPITNPEFACTLDQARAEIERMRAAPVGIVRPLLVLDGWHSPGVPAFGLGYRLMRATGATRADVMAVSYPWAFSLETAGRFIRRAVQRRGWAGREIDVVGVSMGGILARGLAADTLGAGGGWFKPARMFTLVSPHRGARLAEVCTIDPASRQLRCGSAALAAIDGCHERAYELTCYALLRDWMVGATRTAPEGMEPLWVDPVRPLPRMLSHFASVYDARIIADVSRRLRREAPLAGKGTRPPRD